MGILRALRPDVETTSSATTSSGALARVALRDGREHLEVRDPAGRLVFEYDPESGRTVLTVPEGDLTLRAPRGQIDLEAARGVRCQSPGPIALTSASSVSLGVAGGREQGAEVLLAAGAARLRAPRLGLQAREATVAAETLRYRGQRLQAKLESALLVVDRVETVAKRIFERAVDVYRRVEELHQLRAGRVRTQVEGAHVVQAGTSDWKARGPVRIDGERIELG